MVAVYTAKQPYAGLTSSGSGANDVYVFKKQRDATGGAILVDRSQDRS